MSQHCQDLISPRRCRQNVGLLLEISQVLTITNAELVNVVFETNIFPGNCLSIKGLQYQIILTDEYLKGTGLGISVWIMLLG